MKQFILVLVLVSPLALAEAEADADADAQFPVFVQSGIGFGSLGAVVPSITHVVPTTPRCHTVLDTVTRMECNDVTNSVCNMRILTTFRTEIEQVCTNEPVEECHPVSQVVPKEICATETEKVCRNIVDHIPEQQCTPTVDISYRNECHDEVEQVCTNQEAVGLFNQHRIGKREAEPEADAKAEADAQFVGFQGFGFGGLGHVAPLAVVPHIPVSTVAVASPIRHVIAAAPLTVVRTPVCRAVTRKVCRNVPVQTPSTACVTVQRAIPRTVCTNAPKTRCETVSETVVRSVCNTRSVQACASVPKKIPVQTQVEECNPQTTNVCTPVAQQVARKVCQQVAVVAPVAVAPVVVAPAYAPRISPLISTPVAAPIAVGAPISTRLQQSFHSEILAV